MSYRLVSVCIPVYNVEPEYLDQTLRSLLSQQGLFSLEIVVSDDSSKYDYRTLVPSLADSRVVFERTEKNLGMVGNWNHSVKCSSGELVMVFGHDDVMLPGSLGRFVRLFATHEKVVGCGCARQFIDEEGNLIHPPRRVNDRSNIFVEEQEYTLDHRSVTYLCLRNGNVIGEPSGFIYRRSAYDAVGGYGVDYDHAADLDFALRLSSVGQLSYVNTPLFQRRIHSDNLTSMNLLRGRVSADRERISVSHRTAVRFQSRELSSFDAFLFFSYLYDVVRGVVNRNLRLLAVGAKGAFRWVRLTPVEYFRLAREVWSCKNRDRM